MAITLGVGPVAAAYSGTAITLALNGTTAGRSLVVGFIYLSSATVVNVACDGGESDLTLHGATANATSGVSAQMASLGEIATGGNKTVTVNFSADPGFALAFVLEAAGGDIASFFDVGAGASGNDATPTVNVTTSADNALVVAIAHNLGGVPTAGGAYVSVTVGTQTVGEYDLDAGAAGSKTVDFSSVSNQWVVRAAAFNAAPPSAAITVSGGGAITPAGEKGALGSVAVTGDGSVVVVGPPHVTGTAAVSGSGSVAVLGVLGWTTVAAVTGDGSIVVAGFQSYFWQDTGALPMWSEDSAYESQGVFIESALLPAWMESSTLLAGGLFVESAALPSWIEISALGAQPFVEAAILPMWLEDSRLEAEITALFRGWAENLKNGALSEYTNFPFNSFARFNGEYLAAGDGGIYALSGEDDDGTQIDARVRLALTDLGVAELKRIEEAFISYRADGRLFLRLVIDGGQTYEYPMAPTGRTGIYQARVKTGRGLKMNYVCLEIVNFEGVDFDLDKIRIRPVALSRWVG